MPGRGCYSGLGGEGFVNFQTNGTRIGRTGFGISVFESLNLRQHGYIDLNICRFEIDANLKNIMLTG